jgi:hypothetical protein
MERRLGRRIGKPLRGLVARVGLEPTTSAL